MAKLRRVDEAASHFERALRINPWLDEAHNNLGLQEDCMARIRLITGIVVVLLSGRQVPAEFGDVLLELRHPVTGDGASAAMTENYVVVGAPLRRTAYAFDVRTGNRLPDMKWDMNPIGFGGAVDVEGNIVIVSGDGVEAVYVFDEVPEPSALAMTTAAWLTMWRRPAGCF
jgi:hypothetical protein